MAQTIALDKGQLSYATDLMFGFDSVQSQYESNEKLCDCLINIVKDRIGAEWMYARTLNKIVLPSDFQSNQIAEAIFSLRGDATNRSEQHRIFAQSLEIDILAPLVEYRQLLITKQRQLDSNFHALQHHLQNLEDRYKKSCIKLDKSWKDASNAIKSCGAEHIVLNFDLLHTSPSLPDVTLAAVVELNDVDKKPHSMGESDRPIDSTASAGDNDDKVEESNGHPSQPALVQPALASQSSFRMLFSRFRTENQLKPNPKPAHDRNASVHDHAVSLVKRVDEHRRTARKHWEEFAKYCTLSVVDYQLILTQYQEEAERFDEVISGLLKKYSVIESSLHANGQYDIQMLFKVFERVSTQDDLSLFIQKSRNFASDDDDSAVTPTKKALPISTVCVGSVSVLFPLLSPESDLPNPPVSCRETLSELAVMISSNSAIPSSADDKHDFVMLRRLPLVLSHAARALLHRQDNIGDIDKFDDDDDDNDGDVDDDDGSLDAIPVIDSPPIDKGQKSRRKSVLRGGFQLMSADTMREILGTLKCALCGWLDAKEKKWQKGVSRDDDVVVSQL